MTPNTADLHAAREQYGKRLRATAAAPTRPESIDWWVETFQRFDLFDLMIDALRRAVLDREPEEGSTDTNPADSSLAYVVTPEKRRLVWRYLRALLTDPATRRESIEKIATYTVWEAAGYVSPPTEIWQASGFLETALPIGFWKLIEEPLLIVGGLISLDSRDAFLKLYHGFARVAEALRERPPPYDLDPIDRQEIRQGSSISTFGPLLEVDNSLLYHHFRAAVANGREAFTTRTEAIWPTADIGPRNRKLEAIAQVRPDPRTVDPYSTRADDLSRLQERMAQHVLSMDDLTADVLDAVCTIWIKHARHPDEMAHIWADDLLRLRGLTPHKSGAGRRGGYREHQRRELASHIAALGTTWITVTQMDVTEKTEGKRGPSRQRTTWTGESPALVVSFRIGKAGPSGQVIPETCTAWRVRPGDVFARFLFGPGRQTALLSQKALEYDPYRHRWEKRLARYFAWQWRIQSGGSEARSVATLLDAASETVDAKNPIRTKERLEAALDRLQTDGVIADWRYEAGTSESIIGRKGWADAWQQWKILVEPPQAIMDHYTGSTALAARTNRIPAAVPIAAATELGGRVKAARLVQHFTQLQAAEQIGISNSVLSRIERGHSAPSEDARRKIERWLGAIDPRTG